MNYLDKRMVSMKKSNRFFFLASVLFVSQAVSAVFIIGLIFLPFTVPFIIIFTIMGIALKIKGK